MIKRSTRFITLSLCFFMLLTFTGLIHAAEEGNRKKMGLGLTAGYSMYNEDQFNGGVMFGLNLFYSISKNIRLEIKGLVLSSDVDADPAAFSAGKMTSIPVQLSLQYQFPVGKKLMPYLSAGAGYYINKFELDGASEWAAVGFDVEDKLDSSFGFHFGAGLDFLITSSIAFNLDFRYCLVNIAGTYHITDTATGISNSGDIDGKLNPMMLGAGFTFLF